MQEDTEHESPASWKMLSIKVIYIQDSIPPVVPELISSDPEYLKSLVSGRKSYRLLSWVMQTKGYSINNKLPGLDERESIERVLRKNNEWLLS